MNRTTAALLAAAVAFGSVVGCATAPISAPTPVAPASPPSASTTSAAPGVQAPTPGTASAASPVPTAAVKKIATAKLPAQVGDRRTAAVSDGAGGQSASYYKPMETADVIHAAVTPIGTVVDAAAKLPGAKPVGGALCGAVVVAGKQTGACVVGFDTGYLLVNGSGGQSIETVAAFTNTLYGVLP